MIATQEPFCAEGAEKILYVIAMQEPFAPKARRIFFLEKLNPETAKISLCKIAFFFSLLNIQFFWLRAKFLKNGGYESRFGVRPAG